MHRIKLIRPLIAIILVLLFIVSNTPRQLMHDIFASHVDASKTVTKNAVPDGIHEVSFHCQCQDLVAESPYSAPLLDIYAADFRLCYLKFPPSDYQFTSHHLPSQFSLRGPPVL